LLAHEKRRDGPVRVTVSVRDLQSSAALPIPTPIERPNLPDPFNTDASKIVRICDNINPPQICVVSVGSGQQEQLTHDLTYVEMSWPYWTPDGQWIYFRARRTQDSPWNLYNIRSDGSGGGQLLPDGDDVYDAIYSPDGQTVVFGRGDCRVLRLMNPDGSGRRAVDIPGGPCLGSLAWSPDSSKIAFVDYSQPQPHLSAWVINADGSQPKKIFEFPKSVYAWIGLHWSPDGKRIGAWFAEPDSYWDALLLDSTGQLPPEPIVWETPVWWMPNFYSPFAK
jgi:Tol biopolymer transport system component